MIIEIKEDKVFNKGCLLVTKKEMFPDNIKLERFNLLEVVEVGDNKLTIKKLNSDEKEIEIDIDEIRKNFFIFKNVITLDKKKDINILFSTLESIFNDPDNAPGENDMQPRERIQLFIFKLLNIYFSEVLIYGIGDLSYTQEVWYHATLQIKKQFKGKTLIDLSPNIFRVFAASLFVNARNRNNVDSKGIEMKTGWNFERNAQEKVSDDSAEIIYKAISIKTNNLEEEKQEN